MTVFLISNIYILSMISIYFSSVSIVLVGSIGCIFLILLVRITSNRNIYKHLLILVFISLVLSLVMYFGLIQKYGEPYYLGGSDDKFFESSAKYIIEKRYFSIFQVIKDTQFLHDNSSGFSWMISIIMRISGGYDSYHTIIYRVLNVYFLVYLGLLVYSYLKKNNDSNPSINISVLYWFVLFPNIQYINAFVFRDTLVTLLIFLIFYIWDYYSSKMFSIKKLIVLSTITIITGFLLSTIRFQSLIFMIAAILVVKFLCNKQISNKIIVKLLLVIIAITISLFQVGIIRQYWNFYSRYSQYLLETNDGISRKIFSLDLVPLGLILRIAFGLITPFPAGILKYYYIFTDIDVFFDFYVSVGTILQIFLMPFLFMNYNKIDKITVLFLVFFLITISTTFTFRHFILIYPFMAIMIYRKYIVTSYNLRIIMITTMLTLVLPLAFLYIMLKA